MNGTITSPKPNPVNPEIVAPSVTAHSAAIACHHARSSAFQALCIKSGTGECVPYQQTEAIETTRTFLQAELSVRAESDQLQGIKIGLAINENEVWMDVTIAMIGPITGESMVAATNRERHIVCQSFDECGQVRYEGSLVRTFHLSLEVALES